MSIKSTLKWLWTEAGRSDKARRRNVFILFVLVLAVLAYGFYCGAIQIAVSKALQ
jgi:cell division protein FtsB